MTNRPRFDWRTLRVRLTAWYIVLLGLILLLFSVYLYIQLQRSLLAQLDAALEVVASQAMGSVNDEGDYELKRGDTVLVSRLCAQW